MSSHPDVSSYQSARLAVLLKPRFPAVRSRAVSRTGPRPLRRGLSRLRQRGVHCVPFHRRTCRRCRTSMDPSSMRTRLWFRFQPAPMVVPTLGTVQLHAPCRVLLRVVPELTTYPYFLQALSFFVQPMANYYYPTSQKLSRAGSVKSATPSCLSKCAGQQIRFNPFSVIIAFGAPPVVLTYAESVPENALDRAVLLAHPKRVQISGANSISRCRRPDRRIYLSK